MGGQLGMNPLIVGDYYRNRGYDVRLYSNPGNVPPDYDAYLALYFYGGTADRPLGAHYVALEYDPQAKQYVSYNDPKELDGPQQVFPDFAQMKATDEAHALFVWGIDKPGK